MDEVCGRIRKKEAERCNQLYWFIDVGSAVIEREEEDVFDAARDDVSNDQLAVMASFIFGRKLLGMLLRGCGAAPLIPTHCLMAFSLGTGLLLACWPEMPGTGSSGGISFRVIRSRHPARPTGWVTRWLPARQATSYPSQSTNKRHGR